MDIPTSNLFLTGRPGIGKTTVIQKAIERLSIPVVGFYTREIREGNQRAGFSIITLDGREGILAHRGARGRWAVGRYTVNMADIEGLAIPAMRPRSPEELIVIDEVGKMECLSKAFRQALIEVLDSPNTVLGTIALKGSGFIESIKARRDVSVLEVGPDNRDQLPEQLRGMLQRKNGIGKSPGPGLPSPGD
jgi:nucleoside-triphosphatase